MWIARSDQLVFSVTEEGELRQIENWDKLSEKEKQVAWTRLRKRNLVCSCIVLPF